MCVWLCYLFVPTSNNKEPCLNIFFIKIIWKKQQQKHIFLGTSLWLLMCVCLHYLYVQFSKWPQIIAGVAPRINQCEHPQKKNTVKIKEKRKFSSSENPRIWCKKIRKKIVYTFSTASFISSSLEFWFIGWSFLEARRIFTLLRLSVKHWSRK